MGSLEYAFSHDSPLAKLRGWTQLIGLQIEYSLIDWADAKEREKRRSIREKGIDGRRHRRGGLRRSGRPTGNYSIRGHKGVSRYLLVRLPTRRLRDSIIENPIQ